MAKKSLIQFMRYGVVGVVSNLSGYLVYLGITHMGAEPKETAALLYIIGASIGFAGNRQWAFSHKGKLRNALLRYIVAHFFGCLINLMLLWGFVDILGYDHRLVQAIAIFIVAAYLFLVLKYFVFGKLPVAVEDGQ